MIDVRPSRIEEELRAGRCAVIAGFQGVSPSSKEITTLGRGDRTSPRSPFAARFSADRCEIRKDVDGVYSADPREIPGARHLPSLSARALLDMTFWGAKALCITEASSSALALEIPLVVALADGPNDALAGEERSTRICTEEPAMHEAYERSRVLSVNSHKDVRWAVAQRGPGL